MSSKFINTQQKTSINSLVEGFKDKLNNPYYLHTDKKPTPTTYYNQNIHKSTLDEGSKLQYSALGKDSPARYNKIYDLFIYGLEKIIIDVSSEEWGLEANSIEGEAIILPNTIVPIANDYFTIDMIKNKTLLFKILSCTPDTIENGANFYRISYKLDQITSEQIEEQVVEEYTMIVNNVGTKFNSIIRKNDYNFIDKVEDISSKLKTYYKELFYCTTVQTFIFSENYSSFYDPYMIEFLKRHSILEGGDNYIFVTHQTYVPRTFSIDYDRTFFRFIEQGEITKRNYNIYCQGKGINEPLSIFQTTMETYYKLEYTNQYVDRGAYLLNTFSQDLLDRIKSNTKYTECDKLYLNIIIMFFNNEKINGSDLLHLNDIDFMPSMELFYNIPILIYIIEKRIKALLQ